MAVSEFKKEGKSECKHGESRKYRFRSNCYPVLQAFLNYLKWHASIAKRHGKEGAREGPIIPLILIVWDKRATEETKTLYSVLVTREEMNSAWYP